MYICSTIKFNLKNTKKMARFKVNDEVIIKENKKKGIIVCRDEVTDKENNRTEVKYFVKLGNGLNNYKWLTRKDFTRYIPKEVSNKRIKSRIYDLSNGYKLTLVSIVETVNRFEEDSITFYDKERSLRIGYALCNPADEFNENVGFKIARHRAYAEPFTHIVARFTGEFNEATTEAIMDAKAQYITENIANFINA